jgi:hypothetical protein
MTVCGKECTGKGLPLVVGLVHETLQGRETTIADQFQITQVSLGKDNVFESSGLFNELRSDCEVSSVKVL